MVGHRSRGQRDHIRQPGGNVGLAIKIGSPADDRAVALQGQTVQVASGDGSHIRQPGRNGDLAKTFVSPADDRAIDLQGQAVQGASSNGRHIRQPGGNVSLAIGIVSPTDDRAIGLQGQTVSVTSRYSRHVRQPSGKVGLARSIVSPADDRAVALQGQTVSVTSRYSRHVRQPSGKVGLAIIVQSPADDGDVGHGYQSAGGQVGDAPAITGKAARQPHPAGVVGQHCAGQLRQRKRPGYIRRRHGVGAGCRAGAGSVKCVGRRRERLAGREDHESAAAIGAHRQLQPASAATEGGRAEVQRDSEEAVGDGGGGVGHRTAELRGSAGGVVERSSEVIQSIGGRASRLQAALIGKGRAERRSQCGAAEQAKP